jgi:hypothetical protein
LIWPGFLVVWFGLGAAARRRWPRTGVWKPRPPERDRVNRFGSASALVFFIAGTAVLVDPGRALDLVSGGRLPAAGYAAFAYDSDFAHVRGLAVLAVIAAQLVLLLVVGPVRGRWEPATRRAQVIVNIVTCCVLVWVLVAGSIFRQPGTDASARGALALTIVLLLVDTVLKAAATRGPTTVPARTD